MGWQYDGAGIKPGPRPPALNDRKKGGTMATKVQAQKFDTVNKSQLKTPVKHTRTGQCTSRGKCYHGKKR